MSDESAFPSRVESFKNIYGSAKEAMGFIGALIPLLMCFGGIAVGIVAIGRDALIIAEAYNAPEFIVILVIVLCWSSICAFWSYYYTHFMPTHWAAGARGNFLRSAFKVFFGFPIVGFAAAQFSAMLSYENTRATIDQPIGGELSSIVDKLTWFAAITLIVYILTLVFLCNRFDSSRKSPTHDRQIRNIGILLFSVSLLIVGCFLVRPHGATDIGLSPIGITYVALSAWCSVICGLPLFLKFCRNPKQLPTSSSSPAILPTMLCIYFVWLFWTDNKWEENHRVSPESIEQHTSDLSLDMRDKLERFLDNKETSGPVPIIFVSAAGGGLRASAWTSRVLFELLKIKGFEESLWSVSTVSGGSLGAVTALLSRSEPLNMSPKCRTYMLQCMKAFYSSDFLTPTLAAMYFRDPFHKSLVISGRSTALFDSWEQRWEKIMNNRSLEAPIKNYVISESFSPILLFNGTVVENGRRVIASNTRLDSSWFNGHVILEELGDPRDWPMSRVIGMTAVFPYVIEATPLLMNCEIITPSLKYSPYHRELCSTGLKQPHVWGHAVDGGYFDNFGARTTADILKATLSLAKEVDNDKSENLLPIVIQISSDPNFDEEDERGVGSITSVGSGDAFTHPFSSILSVRDSHGYLALQDIKNQVEGSLSGKFLHIHLCDTSRGIEAPLSWSLTEVHVEELFYERIESCLTGSLGAGNKYEKLRSILNTH